MTLKDLGIALREAREAKGLDIEAVAIRIKVSGRTLRAIEDGAQEELPHAVYARGFIKSYAALLGVDNQMVMRVVDENYPHDVPEDLIQDTVVTPPPSGRKLGVPLVAVLAALAVLVLAIAGGWLYRQQSGREADVPRVAQPAPAAQAAPQPAPEAPPAPTVEAMPADGATPEVAPSANATGAAATSAAGNGGASVAAAQADAARPARNATAKPETHPVAEAGRPASGPATAQAPQQSAAGQTAAAAVPAAPQGGVFDGEGADTEGGMLAAGTHRIVVIALADCWVHSSADDADVRQFSLRKGQTFALTFSKRLVLKLGNAGGVRIRYNGQEQPSPGESGQVRTLVFPPQAQ